MSDKRYENVKFTFSQFMFYCKLKKFRWCQHKVIKIQGTFKTVNIFEILHQLLYLTNKKCIYVYLLKFCLILALSTVHIVSFFIIILRRNFMQLCWCTQHILWLKLDSINFRTRNPSSKVTPSDIIRHKIFFSVFQPFGHYYVQNNVFAWKWGSSNVISKAIQHATGDVMLVQNNVLKIQQYILLIDQTCFMVHWL